LVAYFSFRSGACTSFQDAAVSSLHNQDFSAEPSLLIFSTVSRAILMVGSGWSWQGRRRLELSQSAYIDPTLGMKVRELVALIESVGWVQVRQRGSHRQFHHPTRPGTVTVAGKPSVDVPPDTLNSVLKQAGLKK
jgi:predicted RNA binding protein YcfA (HicA-like mRNA interferase family)